MHLAARGCVLLSWLRLVRPPNSASSPTSWRLGTRLLPNPQPPPRSRLASRSRDLRRGGYCAARAGVAILTCRAWCRAAPAALSPRRHRSRRSCGRCPGPTPSWSGTPWQHRATVIILSNRAPYGGSRRFNNHREDPY